MHLSISLPQRDPAGLDALLRDIYDPSSPNFRHYLSVAEFTGRFGPTADDYDAAVKFFAANGFRIASVAANRALIDISGTVAAVERVFHVHMGLYQNPTEQRLFLAPDRAPTLDLTVPVLQVIGLDNETLPRPRVSRATTGRRGTGTGPSGYFIGTDIRGAYYAKGTLTGAGQVLGLMELEGYDVTDVTNFFAEYGPQNSVAIDGISTDGSPVACTYAQGCDDTEQALDIEYAIAMAPGLKQVQVYVSDTSPESVLNRMASDNTSAQLSTSWGWNEEFATDDAAFKEMAAQGQSFLTASGDYSSLKASGPWPEEDANLTAVGGTDLATTRKSGAWKSETGWSGSAGGPSLDTSIKIESYQLPFVTSANKGSTTLRNVPDIAAAARNFYICADATCNGGWEGTSFASPIWTGFIALANEQAAAAGKQRIGFLNPALYRLGRKLAYKSQFHDILTGKSGVYSCTPSFDLVTGLGAPDGKAMLDALVTGY
jgi:subtilase family serine protease